MKHNSLAAKITSAPYMVWMLIFIVAPLLLVAYYSFTDANGVFTLSNILSLKDYSGVFLMSIWYGMVTTAISLVIAYPLAYIVSQKSVSYQSTMIMLIMLPMWMNFLLRTYSWLSILENNGIINTFLTGIGLKPIQMINTSFAVILGMVYNFLPYMILPVYSIIAKMDKSIVEAAQDLGCNRLHVFGKVIFPLSLPGVASGITMVFVPSVSTFFISQKLGGTSCVLIGDTIEQQFLTSYNYNLGAAISLVLMVLLIFCIALMNRFTSDDEGGIIV